MTTTAALDEFQRRIINWTKQGVPSMATDEKTAAREHQRETLNSIIDLLEGLPDKQSQTDVLLSAGHAIGVKVTAPPPPSRPGGNRPRPRKGY